ncbi:MAG: methyltransferase family protein [Candidatus Thorarchaeota archaeon]
MAGIFNLWIFYIAGYAIVYPLRIWAERKRGAPFEDPDLTSQRRVMIPAAIWMIAGLAISFLVPINFGELALGGLAIAIIGLVLVGIVFYSFANQPGLATEGIHGYSRNPNYIGWTVYFLGLTMIGWSESIWSLLFLAYLIYTAGYLHWNVLQEEKFLLEKYGESYQEYLEATPRYLGVPRTRKSEAKGQGEES